MASYIELDDLPFEERLLQDPHDEEVWLEYLEARGHTKDSLGLLSLLDRCVTQISRSEPAWRAYIDAVKKIDSADGPNIDTVSAVYDQALAYVPSIQLWNEYIGFLTENGQDASKAVNRALQSLKVTDHAKLWPTILAYAKKANNTTRYNLYSRFLEYRRRVEGAGYELSDLPSLSDAIYWMMRSCTEDEVYNLCETFESVVNEPSFLLALDRSELELYTDLFDVFIRLGSLDSLAANLYSLMKNKFPDQAGPSVVKMAQYWIDNGDQLRAISTFENGINTCKTLRDFSVIFDSYTEFVDSMSELLAEKLEKSPTSDLDTELGLVLARYEDLLARRPLLINDVYLRQDPNDVQAWIDRAELYDGTEKKQCYDTALLKIVPSKVRKEGALPEIWTRRIALARTESEADKLYSLAVKVPYNSLNDMETVWKSWVDRKVEKGQLDTALKIIKEAVALPKNITEPVRYKDEKFSAQVRMHKSIKLWQIYLDLVESSDDVKETSSVYDRVLELKIATPLTILNYARFLQDHKLYDEMFRVYERGVSIFKYPTVYEIWRDYLTKMARYYEQLGIQPELVRDLFEKSLEGCPTNYISWIYSYYAQFEETHGLKLQALKILERAIDTSDDQLQAYKTLLSKTKQFKGTASMSGIYQKALETLPVSPEFIDEVVGGFVDVEASLGRLQRCREILHYSAELVMNNAKTEKQRTQFWDLFKKFELKHGNESSYKRMLQFKRHLESMAPALIPEEIEGGINFIHAKDSGDKSPATVTNTDQIELDLESDI